LIFENGQKKCPILILKNTLTDKKIYLDKLILSSQIKRQKYFYQSIFLIFFAEKEFKVFSVA
jgi:hypothetical protein